MCPSRIELSRFDRNRVPCSFATREYAGCDAKNFFSACIAAIIDLPWSMSRWLRFTTPM